ncbi:NRDE family protein [Nocardia sp. NPDC088792]|uniref:NRDE family protein n=1 Tax=Nocardia sp. NPDC088792 TaxID=3364332 RepID=UPI0038250B19
MSEAHFPQLAAIGVTAATGPAGAADQESTRPTMLSHTPNMGLRKGVAMCLVFVGWQLHPVFALVIAANRDELYGRPTEPLAWREIGGVRMLCGLDVGSGGTWMGVSGAGRFGVLTDVVATRNGWPTAQPGTRSRGQLIPEFLASSVTPAQYARRLADDGVRYDGFNLLIGDLRTGELWWTSNRSGGRTEALTEGVHGLGILPRINPSWPKVVGGAADFGRVFHADDGADRWIDDYLEVMSGRAARRLAPAPPLPDIDVVFPLRKLSSPRMIRAGFYGTRASTVLRIRRSGEIDMTERRFGRVRKTGETSIRAHIDTGTHEDPTVI